MGNKKTIVNTTTLQQDSSNYWEWSVENDEEINRVVDEERFSAEHIVDNIVRQPAAVPTSLSQANDDYWAWESREQQRSADYWLWPAAKDERRNIVQEQISNTETESYWKW